MELGQYQLQILVSLVVLLGAAFVALICDFLKGHNEQLRELTIELKVRREEEQRRSQMMTAQRVATTVERATVDAQEPPAVRERKRMERIEQQRSEVRAEAPTRASVSALAREAKERKRPPSTDALAAMQRGAELASSPRKRTEPKPVEMTAEIIAEKIEQNIPVTVEPVVTETVVTPEIIMPAPVEMKAAPVTLVAHSANGVKKDWGSLLARKTTRPMQEEIVEHKSDLLDAVVAATSNAPSAEAMPAGFQENFILSRLVQSRQPVSGLVVSIGVNTPRNADGSMPEQVRHLIESLIGPGDFACQSSGEEYLLIYPNERGASAQRRLSEIAQKLWDFQLSSMGSLSILFSWGGVEVRSESIDEAIASANERMQETRRGRKLLTMEPRSEALRQAV